MAAAIPASLLNATSGVATTKEDARSRLASNFETFLTLLTTQLKNQDPLSPMDGNQFTQQLVQMTGVEQQLQTNDLLKSLVKQGETPVIALPGGVELIGKTVSADRPTVPLGKDGATWTYELPVAAKSATAEVLNAKGEVVYSSPLPELSVGRQDITWDGKQTGGTSAPTGNYTLRIKALSEAGNTLNVKLNVIGNVTASELVDGETFLSLGSIKVKLSSVTSVRQAT